MRFRVLILGTVLAAISAGVSQPAPAPRDRPCPYLPAQPGTEWLYGSADGRGLRETVTAVEPGPAGPVVTVSKSDATGEEAGKERAGIRYAVQASGVFAVASRASGGAWEELDPPCCMVRWPPVRGQQWDYSRAAKAYRSGRVTVGPIERVTVPAGTFDAVRIDYDATYADGTPCTGSQWYAEGVGRVKGTGGELALKSFTLEKPARPLRWLNGAAW